MTIVRGMVCICGAHNSLAAPGKSFTITSSRRVHPQEHYGDCHTPIADTFPNIAGLEGWNHEHAIPFFMSGLAPGQPARPPMPQYHMH